MFRRIRLLYSPTVRIIRLGRNDTTLQSNGMFYICTVERASPQVTDENDKKKKGKHKRKACDSSLQF